MKLLSLISFLFLSVFTVSCGDLFTGEKKEELISLTEFSTCEFDVKSMSDILSRNIRDEIECLRDNLHVFMSVVETDRPGYITKSVLKSFLIDGPVDMGEDIINFVDAFFDLSYLVFGGERTHIAKGNVDKMLNFLAIFNEHIWKVTHLFKSTDPVNYQRHVDERNIIRRELTAIADAIGKLLGNHPNKDVSINTEDLIFNFFSDKPELLNKIRSLMFLKRTFLGGETYKLSFREFERALLSVADLAAVTFDLLKVKYYEFSDEQRVLLNVFLGDVDILREHIFFEPQSEESIFTIYDIIDGASTVASDLLDGIDLSKYPKEIMKIKEILLGDGSEFVTSDELYSLLDHATEVMSEADFIYKIYDHYREEMEAELPISIDFSDFPVNNSSEARYLQNFSRIVSSYRFVKGSFTVPYYTSGYRRNPNAYFETAAMEYAIKQIFKFYGEASEEARGGFHISLDQTVALITDFKWALKDIGLISIGRKGGGEIQALVDNFVLLASLFQNQSDGCDTDVCMEVPEAVEFLTGVLASVSVKDFFTAKMLELCADHLDEYNRIEPMCFRANFVKALEAEIPGDGRAIADYMPGLYSYIREMIADVPEGRPATDSEEFNHFIEEAEAFTRKCIYYDKETEEEEVYVSADDAFSVFAGLINVESTVMRFDANKNNILDGWATTVDGRYYKNELMNAYNNVYKGAVEAMVVERMRGIYIAKKLAKPIFLYLIKYGEVPDIKKFSTIWDFVKFILSKNKKANATRATIATVLKVIGGSSDTAINHPFKCEECLRDPTVECTPEGDAWE